MNIRNLVYVLIAILLYACSTNNTTNIPTSTPYEQPPKWSQEAIWYQIFVERFRNGNIANDPTRKSCEGAWHDTMPDNWSVTKWGHDWYAQEEWAKDMDLDFYRTVQMRRYGGDLHGVREKIPYLKELGINAIYFNPINDSPSLHKFDARTYRHVDVTFGDNILEDLRIIAREDPLDPKTWKMTSSDSVFFDLIEKLHANGIRVVLDFSWNHTGNQFWAFQDVVLNQNRSKYKDWYEIKAYDDPNTAENEFEYDGWLGVPTLPDIKKIRKEKKNPGHPIEGNMVQAPKNHIFNVVKKYMDPNGDGDPSDGIDGMRLDVAEHVPLGFWRDFRAHVRSINPDFYLVGENWWTKWPDELMDPAPWVKGDIFDAVMHYQWYKPSRGYFRQSDDHLTKKELHSHLDSIFNKYPLYTQRAMMNLGASHDSPRMPTSLGNTNKYKYNAHVNGDANYYVGPPSQETINLMKIFLLHQFTWIGSPHIWMGDEMGMTGGDDPDNRKPLLWDDINFDSEKNHPKSLYSYNQIPKANKELFSTYKELINLRKSNKVLSWGDFSFLENENERLLIYTRSLENEKLTIIINTSSEDVEIPSEYLQQKRLFKLGSLKDGRLSGMSGFVIK